ncbi:MAG: hypothetical protein HY814_08530 [Candidatus Riflebacteria bacterium]|nr:hypothetical protein [Candidatus Riflebacteria bacterium]
MLGSPSGLTASFNAENLRTQLSSGFVARTAAGAAQRGMEAYVPLEGLPGASQPPFVLTTGAGYRVNTIGATLDLRGK